MNEKETIALVHLNAKLRPEDQGELEDAFLEVAQELNINAEIIGGGSLVDDNGESVESVIEIALAECNDGNIDYLTDHIIAFFEATLAPKGSSLFVFDQVGKADAAGKDDAHQGDLADIQSNPPQADENLISEVEKVGRQIPFGHQEGLALYLNGRDLPMKTYKKYNIKHVFDKCNSLLKGIGMVNSYWEGNSETALYMYGNSYEQMVKRIEPFVSTYPLCAKSRMVKIA
ncbi:hypothetical protein [Psychrobacter pygoscelis]|uniref:hypothetical protein n=1 Tax=Psychrobacter pygoscelis TaxID=2488563 RepID=UPI00103EE3C5|nr:hypothetical protein [Psychrobacter pygoscelis]